MSKQQDSENSEDSGSDQQQETKKSETASQHTLKIHSVFHKKINLKRIVINISDTQYPVVHQVAEELDWKIQRKRDANDWDLYWTDSAIMPDVLFKMQLFQKINHYPGMHIIARKNLLGLNLMAMREKFKEDYNFFPLTWMLPSQYSQFRHYFESVGNGKVRTYIVKPQASCQGKGIFLTRNIEQLTNGNHYVVQRYINKPFLIDSLKFDFRIYVLLAGTDPLRVYIYKEGLARFATESYKQPSTENMQNMCMHLTNYAVNKLNPKFIFNSSDKNMGIGHKRSLTSVFKLLERRGFDVKKLKNKINDLIIKTFITGLPLINHQYRYCQPEEYAGNMCFHILGFDIMLTSDFEPNLLQVNHTPSFTTDTPLDAYIKGNLIKDTLILMNINVNRKKELYQRAKSNNDERFFMGKRKIYVGTDKEAEIAKAQRQRDAYQQKNMGGFEKIHPILDEQQMKKYEKLLEYSNKIFTQENTLRSRIFKEEHVKLKDQEIKIKEQKIVNHKFENSKVIQEISLNLNKNNGNKNLNPVTIKKSLILECTKNQSKEYHKTDKSYKLHTKIMKLEDSANYNFIKYNNEIKCSVEGLEFDPQKNFSQLLPHRQAFKNRMTIDINTQKQKKSSSIFLVNIAQRRNTVDKRKNHTKQPLRPLAKITKQQDPDKQQSINRNGNFIAPRIFEINNRQPQKTEYRNNVYSLQKLKYIKKHRMENRYNMYFNFNQE